VFGSLAVPGHSLRIVLRHAMTIVVMPAEIVLGRGVSLFGSLAVPGHSPRIVPRHAITIVVQEAQVVLRLCVPGIRQRPHELPHGRIVPAAESGVR
jgi:hypothetical protein